MTIPFMNINPQKEIFHNYDFSVYTASSPPYGRTVFSSRVGRSDFCFCFSFVGAKITLKYHIITKILEKSDDFCIYIFEIF